MKYFFSLGLLIIVAGFLRAQCPVRDSISGMSIASIHLDIDSMYTQMDRMNKYFYPLIRKFDSVRDDYNDTEINHRLAALIDADTLFIDNLKHKLDSQYIRYSIQRSKPDSPKYDQTCFYYKSHKEIEDFKYSIELLDNSMKHLVVNDLISTVASIRFLNSYYYMSTCRSLLLARMNNLENEIVLFRNYVPYPVDPINFGLVRSPATRPGLRPGDDENQNKITSATDAMINQTRHGPRNWFLKSTAGGATGALIVYVLASLIRGHK
jgi:hypothetical protein